MTADLSNLLADPAVSVVSVITPHLVEVAVWYPFGAADQAVAAAADTVAELLAQPNIGDALANTPDVEDDSPKVATTAMVQAVRREIIQAAREIVEAAMVDLMTTPGKLSGLLPKEPPADADTLWRDRDGIAFTPAATAP